MLFCTFSDAKKDLPGSVSSGSAADSAPPIETKLSIIKVEFSSFTDSHRALKRCGRIYGACGDNRPRPLNPVL